MSAVKYVSINGHCVTNLYRLYAATLTGQNDVTFKEWVTTLEWVRDFQTVYMEENCRYYFAVLFDTEQERLLWELRYVTCL